jgi:uncharacterized coiled-coil protein SlyX
MEQTEALEDLQSRIAFLQKHVEAQDAEMYQLSKRVDNLVKVIKEQKAQIASIAEMNSDSPGEGTVDERPPHY